MSGRRALQRRRRHRERSGGEKFQSKIVSTNERTNFLIRFSSQDEKDIQRCFTAQRQLLLNAIDSVNEYSSTGGYIVYSTCSILVEENEAVVQYALNNRPVKLVETGLEFGVEGFTK